MNQFINFTVIIALIVGIWQFREPRKAVYGNLTAAFAIVLAVILVLFRNGVIDVATVAISLLIGSAAGYALARAINMVQVPAMIAFQHGFGGVAAFLVALVELSRSGQALSLLSQISGLLGLAIGSLTFSGSMIASARLAGILRQDPRIINYHNGFVTINLVSLVIIGILTQIVPSGGTIALYIFEIVLGISLGILLAIRIGGADMPVLISSLNATAGMAASLCGIVIENQLLIVFGATVTASGSILTYVMCKGMNRKLGRVILPSYQAQKRTTTPVASTLRLGLSGPDEKTSSTAESRLVDAADALQTAKTIIIVPGYGMALAKAQTEVSALASALVANGQDVKYAIHPVAGRMPGHMNVLLAEAGVDYDMLVEMETINQNFQTTDLALVIGACDVVNPAAMRAEGTPISGMPILKAYKARKIICCNFDRQPGYSGVENPLYDQGNTIFLSGDAKNTIDQLQRKLSAAPELELGSDYSTDIHRKKIAIDLLTTAKNIIIIPGYGMALARAQFQLAELASLLEQRGIRVKYAIHPVAGRMPGHMNVLLAEADANYENLLDLEEANPIFSKTDVVIVIGACDVINPAAIESQDTPISGMPILLAHKAKNVIICNFDKNPGYSGVPNSLYDDQKTIFLFGDAKETIETISTSLQNIWA